MSRKIINQSYYKWKKSKKAVSNQVREKVGGSTVDYIFSLVKPKIQKKMEDLVVLDVGSGYGEYSFEIAKRVKEVVGVEPFIKAFNEGQKRKARNKVRNVVFYNIPIENFESNIKFDLAVNLSVIEHMPNAEKSFERIFKLLQKGGYLYLTAPNRLWPYENHYRLPFLSWLPLILANRYVRITGRGQSYADSAYSRTLWGMKRLLGSFPCSYELILPSRKSSFIGLGYGGRFYHLVKNIGIYLIGKLPLFWIFSKGFIFLVKNESK